MTLCLNWKINSQTTQERAFLVKGFANSLFLEEQNSQKAILNLMSAEIHEMTLRLRNAAEAGNAAWKETVCFISYNQYREQ